MMHYVSVCLCVFSWIHSINDSGGAIDGCYHSVERKWYMGTRFGYHADSSARWGPSQHGVGLPVFTAQTHTWHTWQRRLSQSPDAVGVWVPLEPRQDWRGVFHRQLEGEKRDGWRRKEKRVEYGKCDTQRHRDSVCWRGVSREKWWRCWVNTKQYNLHSSWFQVYFYYSAPIGLLVLTTVHHKPKETNCQAEGGGGGSWGAHG